MQIGIDIHDTLTNISEKLENAELEYAKKLKKDKAKDVTNLVDKNDGNVYQAKYALHKFDFLLEIWYNIITFKLRNLYLKKGR